MAIPALLGLGAYGGYKALTGAMKPKDVQVAATPAAVNPAQVVDPESAQNASRGRAALIATSPSGVQGSDPTGRRRLLGN